MSLPSTEIAIVGGGLAGVTLALALESLQYSVTLIETKPLVKPAERHFDSRCLSLSWGSVQILQSLGLWKLLATNASPIAKVHVSDQGHFGRVCLSAEEQQVPALGYVIEMPSLAGALWQRLTQSRVTVLSPTTVTGLDQCSEGVTLTLNHTQSLHAGLVVAADGAESGLRQLLGIVASEHDYQQSIVVTNVALKRSHQNVAYERFTPVGTLAMLPLIEQRCAAIWALSNTHLAEWGPLSDVDYLQRLQHHFGYRLGKLLAIGTREIFPLKRVDTSVLYQGRVMIFGSASHHIHPVAAQGFNLTMRDIAGLLEVLHETPLVEVPARYQTQRLRDQRRTIAITERLVDIFATDTLPVVWARNMALHHLQRCAPLKTHLGRVMMGLGV